MKLIIFKSKTSKAVYCWNGEKVVTIIGTSSRPLGKVVTGFTKEVDFDKICAHPVKEFMVGSATYTIVKIVNTWA